MSKCVLCGLTEEQGCDGHKDSEWNLVRHSRDQNEAGAIDWFLTASFDEKQEVIKLADMLLTSPIKPLMLIGRLAFMEFQHLAIIAKERQEESKENQC